VRIVDGALYVLFVAHRAILRYACGVPVRLMSAFGHFLEERHPHPSDAALERLRVMPFKRGHFHRADFENVAQHRCSEMRRDQLFGPLTRP
jgi:hypothetical protein